MEKFYKPLLILLFAVFSFSAYGQKDAPIAGHAAMLIDLLKKNYSSIDPDVKDEEIARDRTLVISIFKSYLEDGAFASAVAKKSSKILKPSIEELLQSYNSAKKQLIAYTGNPINLQISTTGVVKPDDINLIKDAAAKVEKDKGLYYDAKSKFDEYEFDGLTEAYSNNTFVQGIVSSFKEKYDAIHKKNSDSFAGANYTSSLQKSIPFIGGSMGFETYLDGMARFLAKRIKDELTNYAIENIKIWLENPSAGDPLAEFKVIMPRTTAFIKNFNADRLTSFPNETRQYIADDLDHILENAYGLKQTPRMVRLISQNPELEFAFDALKIVPELSGIKYPIDYFKLLENSEALKKWDQPSAKIWQHNLVNTMKMASMMAYSMIVMENDEPRFAGSSFLSSYAGEKKFYELYTGFLHQQNLKYHQISFKDSNGPELLSTQLALLVKSDASFKDKPIKKNIETLLTKIGTNAEKVYTSAMEIRQAKKAGKKIGADTVFTFVNSIIDLSDQVISSGGQLSDIIIKDNSVRKELSSSVSQAQSYIKLARNANEVIHDLQRKQFAAALTKSLQLASVVTPNTNLSNVSAVVSRIAGLQPGREISDWNLIVSQMKADKLKTAKNAKDLLDDSAIRMAMELNNIKQFYMSNYSTVGPTIGEIDGLRDLIFNVSNGEELNYDALVSKAKTFLDTDTFKLLIVSYYTNTAIDKVAEKLSDEIKNYKLNDKPLFSGTQADAFKSLVMKVGQQLYINYVINGKKDEKDAALADARNALYRMVNNLAFNLPQRTDLNINPKVVSMINFVNGIATAEDSEGVQKAIEAFALPTGSYTVKRKSLFNLSVNSYPGILSALDVTWKYNAESGKNVAYEAPSFGFTAPVGLSFTWGNKDESSQGVFVPIIDIGALTRFRFDDSSSTKALPELKFSNVFSPGLYYHYDFKKSPFTIYFGAQYGPELREVTTNAENIEISKSFESARFGVGLVLDIPLLNIYTKSRL
jgi:hypothetical protein